MGARRSAAVLFAVLAGASGCAVHLVGIVEPTAQGPVLETPRGEQHHLLLDAGSRPMAALDGHLVEVDGRKLPGGVRVEEWRIIEGPHGMTTWAGNVVAYGVQIGIEDRNSGALYFVDDLAARALQPHLGEIVAVEGYVDGPHRIQVLYWTLLAR